jgi:transcription elongation regulator 1
VYPSQASWQETIPQLEKDPRWEHPALTLADKHDMFIAHLQSLAHKRLDALHKLFLAHAPSLDTPFEDVYPEIVNDFAVTRLGLTPEKLQSRYEEWQRVRFQQSKAEFQALLKESSFVDFWGRMKNKALASQGVIPNEDSDEEDEGGDETGGKANLEMMAKQIDLKEMHDVLQVSSLLSLVWRSTHRADFFIAQFQHDKRYLVFDHVPEEREAWLRVSRNLLSARGHRTIPDSVLSAFNLFRNTSPASIMHWRICTFRPSIRHDLPVNERENCKRHKHT